jgi:hypothetical protein
MRQITDHVGNPVNDKLTVTAVDGPGPGGASHLYQISGPPGAMMGKLAINFQHGPIAEVGINGVTQEALLAVVIDRLQSFQKGAFACYENQSALMHCRAALDVLHARTRDRVARGVEGYTKT